MTSHELGEQLRRLHRESFGWAMRCCAEDVHRAEEVLQAVYLKVLDGRAVFAERAAFRTWLFAVIRKTAADAKRWAWLRRLVRVPAEQLETRAAVEAMPADRVIRDESARELIDALAKLPARQQQVLQLVFYHDMSIADAASVMSIGVGSARTHYERGKQSLRRLLKSEGHERDAIDNFGRVADAGIVPATAART